MSLRTVPALLLALALAATFTACPEDDGPLPLGSSCSAAVQCESNLCLSGQCLDPSADEDEDGLLNSIEGALGTDPFNADTDGDGIDDKTEVGDTTDPSNSDGDGDNDALESVLLDPDKDCLSNQLDPDNDVPETDPAVLGAKVCVKLGVCGADGAVITATCAEVDGNPVFTCDYGQVADYQATEALCDALDNDCDGDTDEAFVTGGGTTFDGGPYAADAGAALGDTCGTGGCAGGVVICDPADAAGLTCSSLTNVVAESCATGDNDCDGDTDEGGPDLGGCTDWYVDGDEDTWGSSASACLCEADATYTVDRSGDCADGDSATHPEAAGICGADSDCVGGLLDADEPCDDGNAVYIDGCDACAAVPWAVGAEPGDGWIGNPTLAATADGYALLWTEGSSGGTGFVGKVIGGNADANITDPLLADEYPNDPILAPLSGGGLVLVWSIYVDGDDILVAQRYDAAGALLGDRIVVTDPQEGASDYDVAGLDDDRFVISWLRYGEANNDVAVLFFNAEGKAEGETLRPHDASVWAQQPSVARLSGGGCVVAWQELDIGTYDRSLSLRRLDATGALLGDVIKVALLDGEELRTFGVAGVDGDAFMVAAVAQKSGGDVYEEVLFAQRFAADGTLDGDRTVVEDDPDQIVSWALTTAGTPSGAFMVAWGDTGEVNVAARAWVLPGAGATPLTLTLQDEDELEGVNDLVGAAGDDWLGVAFRGRTTTADDRYIFVQRFTTEGTLLYR